MADLQHKVKNSLDEARLPILVVQVFLGFQLRAPFESGFERLTQTQRYLELAALVLFLATAFVLWFWYPTVLCARRRMVQ